jgi:type II secretory pathway pseudopilin PulG
MTRQRGFSLIETMVLIGIVATVTSVAVVAFGYAIHSARTAVDHDEAQLDAYNAAVSLRAAMRYDRGAVAAIGAASATAWTNNGESFTATPASGSLTVSVTTSATGVSAAIVIPIVQEIPAPQSVIAVP